MTESRNMDSNVVMSSSSSSLSSPSSAKLLNGLEKMGTGKISVFTCDESTTNGLMDQKNGDDDSFILDIDSFSQGFDRDITPNSRFTLQKSLSRKGSHRSLENKISSYAAAIVKDAIVTTTCSPRAAGLGGNSTPVSPSPVVMSVNPNQHQITITSGNIISGENKLGLRRNSFRRSSSSLGFDPRRILLFFATLSSMGTMILIYFTLSMRKLNEGDGTLYN